jgi:hypothetical protein
MRHNRMLSEDNENLLFGGYVVLCRPWDKIARCHRSLFLIFPCPCRHLTCVGYFFYQRSRVIQFYFLAGGAG